MTSADDAPARTGDDQTLVVKFDDQEGSVTHEESLAEEVADADTPADDTPAAEEEPPDEVERVPERRRGAWATHVSFDPDTGQELVVHRCTAPPPDLRGVIEVRREALRRLADTTLPVTGTIEVEELDGVETLVVIEEAPAGPSLAAVVERSGQPGAGEADAVLDELARALAHAEEAGVPPNPIDPEDVYWLADGGVGVVGQTLVWDAEAPADQARSAVESWSRIGGLLAPPVRWSDRWLPGRTVPPVARAIERASRAKGPATFAALEDLLHERAPAPTGGATGSLRRGLVAAAGLLLLGALGLVIIGGLVSLNDDAGGATVTEDVALEGRTARTATPRAQDIDPFADVVFFRVANAAGVQIRGEAGAGGVVGTIPDSSLLASDDERDTVRGFEWIHVHDPISGTWGWVPALQVHPV